VGLITVALINTLLYSLVKETAYFSPSPKATALINQFSVPKDAINRLSQSIQFQTISERDNNESFGAEFESFYDFLEQSYPLVHQKLEVTTINKYSRIFHWRSIKPKGKPILLLAHSDVVPATSPTRWVMPPFEGKITNERIYGRGALDDKASLIAIMEATENLLKANLEPSRDIYIAIGHDEEVGGRNGAIKIAEYLTQKELNFEFIIDEGGYIGLNVLRNITRRTAMIGIAEKGYLSIQLSVESSGGHSSKPEQMTSGGRLIRALAKVQSTPFPANLSFTADFMRNLGSEVPLLQRLVFGNQWLFNSLADQIIPSVPEIRAQIRTTVAPTMFRGSDNDNVIPTNPTAVINLRILPGESIQSTINRISNIIDDDKVSLTIYGYASEPSKISSTQDIGYQLIATSIQQATHDDLNITPMLVIAATDARHYQHLSSQVYRFTGLTLSPGNIKTFHGLNENITLQSFNESIRFYANLIINSSN